jgi:zinc-finger of transposase IS204/IS1001/IS1096/IS1165
MTHGLHTFVTTLLSPTSDVHLDKVTGEQETVRLQLTATVPRARCPRCAVPSSSVPSRYQRHLTDLPWGARLVHIHLTVRKFVCQHPSCERHIFTERLPDLVAAYGRQTHRLATALRAIDLALGGQAGARHGRGVAISAAVHALRAQGMPFATSARRLGSSRPPVYAYLRRETPPGPRRFQGRPSAPGLPPVYPLRDPPLARPPGR